MVHGFKSHSSRQCPITNNCHVLFLMVSLIFRGSSHAQNGGYRCARMSYTKGIIVTFLSLWEARKPFIQAVGMKNIPSASQNLMAVGLMAHIPHQLILRSVKYIVKGYGQFHHAQSRTKMTAVHRDIVHNKLA